MRRRRFVQTAAVSALAVGALPRGVFGQRETRLVVLHTNDTHSRIDPFPSDAGSNAGLGGAARRATLVRRVRAEHDNVLLLDSGDIFQGTPYFNLFGGEVELRAMSEIGYDVGTLGNHDFDNGTEGLVRMLPHADFDFVCANYNITDPGLAERVAPYTIREFGSVKVGILGLGIDFYALVLDDLHQGVSYTDPIGAARRAAEELRNAGCSLVICLSHLGYRYDVDRPSDTALAELVPEIDLILGGHTHTFMDEPDVYRAGETGLTIVNQVGFGGIRLGRIDVTFGAAGEVRAAYGMHYEIGSRVRLG
jgi:5'-nucleotidase